jgi:membrane-associated phospholipid phosphatase
VTIAVLDPGHRQMIPRVLAASLGSGLVANIFKLLLARTRPHHFDLQGETLDSFAGWFPMLGNTSWDQGFPSSHMATAAGLAIVLASIYPRGRWLFPALAALSGFQRVLAEAHFLSDVLWGAAIGCIFASLCIPGGRLSQVFDRLEQRLTAGTGSTADEASPERRPPATSGAVVEQSHGIDRAA